MLHLGRAVEQLNHAMENAKTRGPQPKQGGGDQLLNIGAYLRQLEESAVERGEARLAISLAKPFQRLLRYHFMFQNLLLYANPATSEYESALKMVTEAEAIVKSIEDRSVQEKERNKMWDVLGRIDGLDKAEQLMVPKPSRLLLGEHTEPLIRWSSV